MFILDMLDEDDDRQVPSCRGTKPMPFITRTAVAFGKCITRLVRPSFLSNGLESKGKVTRNHRPYPATRTSTAALDGLRGYAAFAVMNYHILYAYRTDVFYSYGLSPSAAIVCARPEDVHAFNRWPHQLPILRLFYTGTWPISVFYVISGLVLAFKPLHAGSDSFAKGVAAAASSLLRRPFRLYGPPIVATLLTMLVIQAGGYEHGRTVASDRTWVSVINETHQQRFDSLGLQIRDWARQMWRMLNVFWWGERHNQYDVHLWTIPAEFRCSLAVFLILPVYLAIRLRVRKVMLGLLVIYVYALDRWDVALFYSGLLIADTLTPSASRSSPPPEGTMLKAPLSGLIPATKAFLLLASLFLLSAPDFCAVSTPGYRLLGRLIPSSDPAPFRFLPNIGAVMLVSLVVHTRPNNMLLSRLLNSAVPQYLGRISYSLYITHGPLIHTAGYTLFPLFWTVSGQDEPWRYFAGFAVAYLVLVCITVYMADRFCELVDMPFVRLARVFRDLVAAEGE